jgi:hypothetical protein
MEKVDRWYEVLPSLRSYQRARLFRQLMYGLPSDASPFDVTTIGRMGETGELSAIHANQFGVLASRIVAMTTGQDLGWQPVAANSDSLSREDASVAKSVLDYERRAGQLERLFALAGETSFLDASCWIATRWDVRGGTRYDDYKDPRTGAVSTVYTGKLQVTLHPWWRTVMDLFRKDSEHDWIILCDYHNKYDLIARFASNKDALGRLTADSERLATRLQGLRREHSRVLTSQSERGWIASDEDTPLVPVWKLYHRPTDACPTGRETWAPDAGVVLYDGDNVYGQELPAVRMAPGEWLDTPHGHTPLANLAAPQRALNMALSSILTNEANGAVANVWVPPESNLKVSELNGANIWHSMNKPEALALTGTAKSTVDTAQMMEGLMVKLAQLNPAALGQVEQQMSGALAALLESKGREAMVPFIRSVRWCVEQVGTRIVECYKRFAKVPRALEVIHGNERRYMLKDFTGERLEPISRVSVEASSGLMATQAGKVSFVETILQHPQFLQHPNALGILFDVWNTGRVDRLLLEPEGEGILIAAENEALGRGEQVVVRWTDNDQEHIEQHRRLGSNPEIRMDDALMKLLDEHNAMHALNAQLKASGALGPEAAMQVPGTASPPASPLPPGQAPSDAEAPEAPVEGQPIDAGPAGPGMPSMPINPATGERAQPPPTA